MSHFIFMLTKSDKTVQNAMQIYEGIASTAIQYVGFKDIGLPFDELKALAQRIRCDGKKVMLEVVSTSEESELRSVEAAIQMGVDHLLGGRHAEQAVRLLKNTTIQYFPFAGQTVGHPTQLTGSEREIVDDAKRLAALDGVHGLDLLAYRFNGDGPQLMRSVVGAVSIPVIAAGSIDSNRRVQAMRQSGAWAFTVGSAVFDGCFLQQPVKDQVNAILELDGVRA
jgi:hypothetical protein